MLNNSPLLEFTKRGLYCPAGDFYIDPSRGVDRAIITHAHSDHARRGSKYYIAHKNSVPILKLRLGKKRIRGVEYGNVFSQNGVRVSLHPAGHIIGSAQVRVEHKGEVWVVSGDYKLENDGISGEFEPVKCNVFITESTFALPVYNWKSQKENFDEINSWWQANRNSGKISVLGCYVLGKAQRVLHHLDKKIERVFAHPDITEACDVFRSARIKLPRVTNAETANDFKGSMILAPAFAVRSGWLNSLLRGKDYSYGYASGWMALLNEPGRRPAMKRGTVIDRGFALSDHADWNGLNDAVKATGAEKVFVTHGYAATFVKWLRKNGVDAHEVGKKIDKAQLELAFK